MLTDKQTQFIKIIKAIDHSKSEWELFYDFCEMVALTLRLPFYGEKVYEDMKRLRAKYDENAIKEFDKCFELMVSALEEQHQDFLGTIFMNLDMGSKYKGQFFTPYHVSLMCAKMVIGDITPKLNEEKYFSCSDPACGSGAMLIAVIDAAKEEGLNPSTNLYIEAQDIDGLACLMCYIQLSLYGVAANIVQGDTLRMERRSEWLTPVYFINNWQPRIALHNFREAQKLLSTTTAQPEANIRQIVPPDGITMVIPQNQSGQLSFGFEMGKVAV